jgi:hypothetical protein
MSRSETIREWLLLLVWVGALLSAGCTKEEEEEEDLRPVIAQRACRELADASQAAADTRALARKVLEGWANNKVDSEPVLVHACRGRRLEGDHFMLLLTMSDEDFDIAGIGVREVHADGNSPEYTLEEDYPVFSVPVIGHPQLIEFRGREHLQQRKDEQAWRDYSKGNVRVSYLREERPTIWISVPDPPRVKVKLWIYDSAGNRSRAVPLEYGHPVVLKGGGAPGKLGDN